MSIFFKVIILIYYITLTCADAFLIYRLLSNIHSKKSGLPVGPEFFNKTSKMSIHDIMNQYNNRGYFGPLNIVSIILNLIIIGCFIAVQNWAVALIVIIYFIIMNFTRCMDMFSKKTPYVVKLIKQAHRKSKAKRQHTIKLVSTISGVYCAMILFENIPYIVFALIYL